MMGRNITNMKRDVLVLNLEEQLSELVGERWGKTIAECTNEELYYSLLTLTRRLLDVTDRNTGEKKVYYISAEFMLGKLLSNNIINLRIYDRIKVILDKNGKNLADIEEYDPEPSLGSGGLGRLAACFLDSIATLGLPGEGIGLLYHYGLFRQTFVNNKQVINRDPWIREEGWERRSELRFDVRLGGHNVTSRLYDIDVVGYDTGKNKLRLFDIASVDDGLSLEQNGYRVGQFEKNLTFFLYPDDSTENGRLLRLYQQYFLVSCAAQLILHDLKVRQYDLRTMYDHAVIQINDTHPTLIIPELIRILVEEKAFSMDEAITVVRKTCAYTNHTILAEALETWPVHYLEQVAPQLLPYIRELDRRVRNLTQDESVYIIDRENRIHMAAINIHYGFSVNGVAAIHTGILEQSELNNFYRIYPEKFSNKTNGITFRRWLLSCNHELSNFLSARISDAYKKDAARLEDLTNYIEDDKVLEELAAIKQIHKKALAEYVLQHEGVRLDPDGIYDIQAKYFHEYKRQQMNALYIIHKYLEIRNGRKPARPLNFIFGGKAAPAYLLAQDIIHLVKCLETLVNNDPEVNPYMHIVLVTNYNVAYAEKLIPACDISEQISLASKEASGTSNMKFMLNGAVTLGTLDGANVEIEALVGSDNMYIFGLGAETVIAHETRHDYFPREYYEKNADVREAVDFILSPEVIAAGDKESLTRLHDEILGQDRYMALIDLPEYIRVKDRAFADYEDRRRWEQKMLLNIAKAGYFSSDRTVLEYNRDIWHLDNSPAPYVK